MAQNNNSTPGAAAAAAATAATFRRTPKKRSQQKKALILPHGPHSIEKCAEILFTELAQHLRFFVQGGALLELAANKDNEIILQPARPGAFRSQIEHHFDLFIYRKLKSEWVLTPCICSEDVSKALLLSDEAKTLLPPINVIAHSPILMESGDQLLTLTHGYHRVNGGVYVVSKINVPDVPLAEARERLLELFKDILFATPGDESRALAALISPALRFGRLLDCDFPLDLSEADKSQAGKTYRCKVTCALYGEKPTVITQHEAGGAGSLDESVSSALLSRCAFIVLENFRGPLHSTKLESALRGVGRIACRVPYLAEVQVRTDNVCWQLSSNRAETTPDLANRAIVTQIRKNPSGYQFHRFSGGPLLQHVRSQQPYYLGCVFAIVHEWFKRGKPGKEDARHDFREWVDALNWIVQELFSLPPLLDHHQEEQLRISNPKLVWLRLIAIAVEQAGRLDEGLLPHEIFEIAQQQNINIPGVRDTTPEDQLVMYVGKVLGSLFSSHPNVAISGFTIEKITRREFIPEINRDRDRHYYRFEKPDPINP
jgi:hypothetical protein